MSYNLEEITNDFFFNVGLGRFNQDIVRYYKFAKSLTAGTTPKDVWSRSHNLTYSTVPEAYYVISDNIADIGVLINIEGIAEDGQFIREPVTLNGTTAIQLTGLWYRSFRIRIVNGQSNLGNIYVSTNPTTIPTDTQIRAFALLGTAEIAGASFMSHFTVPKGYVGMIYTYTTNAPGNADIEFNAYARKDQGVFVPYDLMSITGNSKQRDFNFLAFPEGYDFKVMVSSSSTVNRNIAVTYDIILVNAEWYKPQFTLPRGIYV